MNEREQKLREERANLTGEMRKLLDKADAEKKSLEGAENDSYMNMEKRAQELESEIQREMRLAKAEKELAESVSNIPSPDSGNRSSSGKDVRSLVEKFNRMGKDSLTDEERGIVELDIFRRAIMPGHSTFTPAEQRALQADSDIYGGFLVPQQVVKGIIKAVDNQVYMRTKATVYQIGNAESLGAPSLDNDPADATWTGEIVAPSEDSTMSLGKRELRPHPLSKLLKISNKLLRATSNGAENLVRDRFAYKFGVVEENAFLNGSGSGEPLGVMTASNDGISTTYDISTENTSTSITADGLINAKYGLKSKYWSKAEWWFHQDALKQIRKLKDGEGQYIWQQSILTGEPDRLLGHPINNSEYMPNTFTASQYVGIIGDFSFYWIADSLSMTIQKLVELYAGNHQTGFIGLLECDGLPVLGEAFRRVKLAAG